MAAISTGWRTMLMSSGRAPDKLTGSSLVETCGAKGSGDTLRAVGRRPGISVGWDGLVLAGQRMWSELFGGHDPQLADGGVAGAGDHVGDAVGDVLGGEDLGLLVEGVDHLVADLGLVVGAQLGRDATGLDESDAYVPLGDFLAQRLGESVHAELGEAVYAVAVPGDAAGDRADVDARAGD